jgi:RNA polymerase sigma factor (sigma-70 family)
MPSLQSIEIAADVLDRAQAGDSDAHECIYRSLSKPVYTLLRRLVVRPSIAEELVQDVFVEILRSVRHYGATGSFVGWVRSIAISKALMYLRSPWHRGLTWLGTDGIRSLHENAVTTAVEPFDSDLERALAMLPAISRVVVWLHDVEEFTHAEIAQLFGRSTSFSKSQLARAHSELRARLNSFSGGLACTPISRNC